MHEQTADQERTVARPNDRIRAAVYEALDLADRAGVTVGVTVYQAHDDPGRATTVVLQGVGDEEGVMSLSDALRIALRAGRRDRVTRQDPDRFCRHTTLDVRLPGSGVPMTIICGPSRPATQAGAQE